MYEILMGATSVIAGAIASIVGFGIGSILTSLLSLQIGTRLAVAVISIPHLFATFVRFVATATAIGLVVDAVRMPVYFVTAGDEVLRMPGVIISSTIGGDRHSEPDSQLRRELP